MTVSNALFEFGSFTAAQVLVMTSLTLGLNANRELRTIPAANWQIFCHRLVF